MSDKYCPRCGLKKAYLSQTIEDKLFTCAKCGQEFIWLGEFN